MIEIIGAREAEDTELMWRELPRNLRQMGETKDRRKIYIEDYVVTYLGKLAEPDQAYARGAVLMGNRYRTEAGEAIFISGAIEAQNLEFDVDETIFNEEIWEELLKKGKEHFPEQKVMGWFLSRMGFSVEINQKIINTHKRNFGSSHQVLYVIDSLEKEDAMYLCENGQMYRQKGYYIYYEKNTPMQEYMIKGKRKKGELGKSIQNEERKSLGQDQRTLHRYRKKNHYKKEAVKRELSARIVRAASLFFVLLMSVMIYRQAGVRFFSDTDFKGKVMETLGQAVYLLVPKEGEVEEETLENETTQAASTEKKQEELSEETATKEEAEESSTESKAVIAPVYYIVKKGDTLAKISRKMYMTDKYMKQIAWANGITNADEIYPGQKIVIPAIE